MNAFSGNDTLAVSVTSVTRKIAIQFFFKVAALHSLSGVSTSPRGQWKTGKMEKTGCKIICGALTTLAVKGLMMMMMMMMIH